MQKLEIDHDEANMTMRAEVTGISDETDSEFETTMTLIASLVYILQVSEKENVCRKCHNFVGIV